ncbi:MAG: hypothetical protein CME06_12645 [Gemmatimonadetes bacterium]|nr:hypothetical protein [Gemmatimonadota bacterium]
MIAPGTHDEHDIDFLGKGITVRGEDPEDEATVAATIVDATGLGRVFHFSAGGTSSALLTGLTVRGGSVIDDWRGGGGILCESSSPTIELCVIEANSSEEPGGGICCRDSSPSIRRCELRDNSGEYGAALYAGDSTVEIERTLFAYNSASVSGGAMSLSGGSTGLANCVMIGNDARSGGAIDLNGGSDGSETNLLACTLIDNRAHYSDGGGVDADSRSIVDIRSTIVRDNWPENLYAPYADIVVEYSNIGGGWDGIGNINEDPLFLAAGDHHISPLSPCVDRGDPVEVPIEDLDGDPRPMGAGVDIGADESPAGIVALLPQGSQRGIVWEAFEHTLSVVNLAGETLPLDSLIVHYAWSGGIRERVHGGPTLWIDAGDTLEWDLDPVPNEVGVHRILAEAFSGPEPASIAYFDLHALAVPGAIRVPADLPSIAGAITLALDGDEVIVAPGTYFESLLSFYGKAIRVTGTDPQNPLIVDSTVIDGDGIGPIMTFNQQEQATSELSGLTIRGGYGTDYGAGIFCENSSPTIEYCAIADNRAGYRGGGAWLRAGSPTLVHCRFERNSIDESFTGGGGGLFGEDCDLALIDCEFTSNFGGHGGGGMRVDGGNLRIARSVFRSNRAEKGGALRLWCDSIYVESCLFESNQATETSGGGAWLSSGADFVNCIFAGNSGVRDGGAMYKSFDGDLHLINTTVVGNETDTWQGAGGIYASHGDKLVVLNSIVWGNRAWGGGGSQQIQTYFDEPLVAFSNVQGGWPGSGNIDAEPGMRNPWRGDFRLSASSPCIDAGTSSSAPPSDYEGDPRPQGGGVDIGADEYSRPREVDSAAR